MSDVLEGVRVVELGTVITAPLTGLMLVDLGAEVIKVEPPQGDPVRRTGPFLRDEAGPDRSLLWFALNASKQGVTLDIEHPDGRALFQRLLANADLVIESFPPGFMAQRSIGFQQVSAGNPRLIWTSIRFEPGSKCVAQTWASSSERATTRPSWLARHSSSAYSRPVRSTVLPSRVW